MRAFTLAFASLSLFGCSFDVDGFRVAGGAGDVGADSSVSDTSALVDSGATDSGALDSGAVDSGVAVDTSAPPTDTLVDDVAPDADPTLCKSKGGSSSCLSCCGDDFPKGRSSIVKHAQTCVCGATVCSSVCDKTFCKPGAPKTPDDACAACMRDALGGSCSSDVSAANAEEPQVTPYLSCATSCP